MSRRRCAAARRVVVLGVLCLLLAACASAPSGDPGRELSAAEKGELFLPSPDAIADVTAALGRAAAEQRLALIVLGANWCHDSRALAARLQREPLSGVAQAHYETVFIDVGYLETGQGVAQRFGAPTYYATPTVLIVDPAGERLVNAEDRHQWGSADSIGMEDTVEYFRRMALSEEGAAPAEPDAALQALYAGIDAYERQLALRVDEGYRRVGPMLRAYKEGGEVPASFEHDWEEVATFRKNVPATIDALRAEARRRVASGEAEVRLHFPAVHTYSWQVGEP